MGSKKAWLIGCGGCLTLIVLIVVAAVIWGVVTVGGMSDGAAKAVFGEKLPEGYKVTIGVPIPEKDGKTINMVLLMNETTQKMLMIFDTPTTEEDSQSMKDMMKDPEALSLFLQGYMARNQSGNSSKIESMTVKPLKLSDKETIPGLRMVMNQKGKYAPVSGTMLFYPGNRMVVLMVMDPQVAESSATADFTAYFDKQDAEMLKVIKETDLSKNLQMPAEEPPAGAQAKPETVKQAA